MDVVSNVALLKTGVYSLKSLVQHKYDSIYKPIQILDPLSTMIRLALLSFYEKGTKISIGNNTIIFHPPGVLQGVTRWSWGSKREDLHLLFKPIVRSLKHFDVKENVVFTKILKYAMKGIKKLKSAYIRDNNVTMYSLNFYIHIIETGHKDADLLGKLDIEDDLNVFSKLWTPTDIKLISILLNKICDNLSSPTAMFHFVKSISHILEVKDDKVRDIIKKTQAKI